MQLHIEIPNELKPFIDQTVTTGSFNDVGAFLTNLVYDFKAQRESKLSIEEQAKLEALRAEVMIGVEEADRGDFVDCSADQIIREWKTRVAAAN